MSLFQDRYRIETTRLPDRDYAQPGKYFVTICTRNRECIFGEIRNGIMGFSEIGCVVAEEIQRISTLRIHVSIDRWVVMPNHAHMIVIIHPDSVVDHEIERIRWEIYVVETPVETPFKGVSTMRMRFVQCMHNNKRSSKWKSGTLGAIMNQCKRACTIRIKKMGYTDFAWQSRFYDRVIRNGDALRAMRRYIERNPKTWNRDRNNPDLL